MQFFVYALPNFGVCHIDCSFRLIRVEYYSVDADSYSESVF